MPTFFVPSEAVVGPDVRITGQLLNHLRQSLRLQPGEVLTVTNDRGTRYRTEVVEVTSRALIGRIVETTETPAKTSPSIVLAQALLKGEKMDWVIQKATELGIERIVPVDSSHSVVRLRADRIDHQLARWQRIALEAAQQSERWSVPVINEPATVTELLGRSKAARLKLLLAERSKGASLTTVSLPSTGDEIWLLVGPEGGWQEDELKKTLGHGFTSVTLGPRILRAETAAIAAITVLQSRFGELG